MRRDLLIGLVLAALTLGVYWPVRNHEFIFYDDPQFITENQQIQSGLSWKTAAYALTRPVTGNWHPVTTLSHALDCQLFGTNAGAHHLVNAFFHAANAALVFLMLRQLTGARWRSAWVAAFFAWHPLRVESVAWVAERKDLLSGFFFLLTLWMYALFAQRQGGLQTKVNQPRMDTDKNGLRRADTNALHGQETATSSSTQIKALPVFHPCPSVSIRGTIFSVGFGRRAAWVFYAMALVFFALGLMSKPMLVTLPFVLLLLDYWPLGRFQSAKRKAQIANLRPLIFEKIPFLLLSIIDCGITWAVQKSAGAMQVIPQITWPERVGNAISSYVRYLGKMFWPTDLAVVYPHPAKHYFLTEAWPSWEMVLAAVLLVLITVLFLRFITTYPYVAVGWFWFLGMMVPVIGLVQVGEQALADRYTYLPLIGPVIGLTWWVSDGIARRNVAQIVNLPASLGITSTRDDFLCTCENVVRRFNILTFATLLVVAAGLVLLTRHQLGYWQNTVTLFEHAVAVTADNPSAQFSLGVGLEKEGEVGKAMVRYRVAVAIDPQYAKAHYNIGQVLRKGGQWQEAAAAYLAALNANPADLSTQLNLASVLPHLGRTPEAIDHFQEALRLEPDSIEGLNNLAWLLATSPQAANRDGARAVQLAERACALTENKQPFLLGTLAAAYAEAGRFAEAVESAQRACAAAAEMGDSTAAAKNQELLQLYRAGKPLRDNQ